MRKTKGIIAEFKEFISRGNVIDMAVGIIIGSSFTAIVTSLVNDVFLPAIGWLVGGINFSSLKLTLPRMLEGEEPAVIAYGSFIQSVVNFLIIALVVFFMVKALNSLQKKKEQAPAAEPKQSEEVKLLSEIRDLLKK